MIMEVNEEIWKQAKKLLEIYGENVIAYTYINLKMKFD